MAVSRRDAIRISGATLAGLSIGAIGRDVAHAQAAQPQEPWPDSLVERPLRAGFPAALPVNPDGSAPEHPASEAGPITDPLMWRTPDRQAPAIEYDYRKMAIKVDTRGLGKLAGTMHFSDIEKLPRVNGTFLLQCGAPNPRGVVKWTGVRFNDFAQVMLAWLMNDQPIPSKHGAPLRLIVPFRYGQRSIKAITEIVFGTPGLQMPPLTA
jgi:DMSO/TMAO reductase YedYZ molybdopterin-dependent catalytic subunit